MAVPVMAVPRPRDPRPLCRLVLVAVVVLTWGFVMYGARVAAQRQLQNMLLAQRKP